MKIFHSGRLGSPPNALITPAPGAPVANPMPLSLANRGRLQPAWGGQSCPRPPFRRHGRVIDWPQTPANRRRQPGLAAPHSEHILAVLVLNLSLATFPHAAHGRTGKRHFSGNELPRAHAEYPPIAVALHFHSRRFLICRCPGKCNNVVPLCARCPQTGRLH